MCVKFADPVYIVLSLFLFSSLSSEIVASNLSSSSEIIFRIFSPFSSFISSIALSIHNLIGLLVIFLKFLLVYKVLNFFSQPIYLIGYKISYFYRKIFVKRSSNDLFCSLIIALRAFLPQPQRLLFRSMLG